MINEELRAKIIEVISTWAGVAVQSNKLDGASVYNPYNAESLADALIAAGIGDVKELQLDKKAYEAASNHYRILFEEAQRRAEIAEKALSNACRNIIADEKDGIEIEPRDEVLYKAYLKQAENELQEERKGEK